MGDPQDSNQDPQDGDQGSQDPQDGDQPGQGGQPGQGTQPGQGGQTGGGSQPGQGTQPDQPGQPGQPGQPDQPGQPGQPGQPDQPSKPDNTDDEPTDEWTSDELEGQFNHDDFSIIDIDGHGCVCKGLLKGDSPLGSPVDEIDRACQTYRKCLKCVGRKCGGYKVNRYGDCINKPGSGSGTCKRQTCECDLEFAANLNAVSDSWSKQES